MKPERIINFIESYNYHQSKIKSDTEKLKYYIIINNKKEANKIIDEILKSKEIIQKILDIKV